MTGDDGGEGRLYRLQVMPEKGTRVVSGVCVVCVDS